ncbi:MAG: CYTH domain-containing protein [Muribaculaceae bacterium]|nr:CYTH domain-containing protein [Muribaculaceae bacterium]
MAKEIEHKYLVADDSYKAMQTSECRIEQGYLCREPERTVRVRVAGDRGFITVKGITVGDVRDEFEYPVPVDDARAMLAMCVGAVVRKVRHYVPFGGNVWEVDEFIGLPEPLVVAEIELPSLGHSYELPPFVGRQVTDDPRYFNSNIMLMYADNK